MLTSLSLREGGGDIQMITGSSLADHLLEVDLKVVSFDHVFEYVAPFVEFRCPHRDQKETMNVTVGGRNFLRPRTERKPINTHVRGRLNPVNLEKMGPMIY